MRVSIGGDGIGIHDADFDGIRLGNEGFNGSVSGIEGRERERRASSSVFHPATATFGFFLGLTGRSQERKLILIIGKIEIM